MTTPLCDVQVSQWSFGALQTTSRGQKSACVLFECGLPPLIKLTTPDQPMNAMWGASAYQDPDAVRLSMALAVSDGQVDKLREIDSWALEANKTLGCKGEDKPLLCEHKYGILHVKAKYNTQGNLTTRLFSPEGQKIPWTKDLGNELRGARVRPVIAVAKIWSSGAMWGLTTECRKAIVEMESVEFPDDL